MEEDRNNNFIGGWFIENKSVCDNLIKYFENNPNRQQAGTVGEQKLDISLKDCTEMYLENNEQILQPYLNELQKVCEKYVATYPWCSDGNAAWGINENIKIQKYKPNQGYHAWHCERDSGSGNGNKRHLVFMTYLNTVTDGGETAFFHQELYVKPQKGLTLIWPAGWTHTHKGIISPSQTKFIVTGWYGYLD